MMATPQFLLLQAKGNPRNTRKCRPFWYHKPKKICKVKEAAQSSPSDEIAEEQCGREEKQGKIIPKKDAV